MALAYLVATIALSSLVGLVRSLTRFRAGTLPDQFLVHSVAANAALMAAVGIVPLVAFLALGSRLSRRQDPERSLATLGPVGLQTTYLLFWGLNTAIGFRVMREFIGGETEPVFAELIRWLPGFVALGGLSWWLLARGTSSSALRRSSLVAATIGLAVVGLHVFAILRNPSDAGLPDLESSAGRHPHVFLVVVDTLRADHLGLYGYPLPTSPNLDAFGAGAVVYTRTFAQAPWTRPSCAALLASRLPPEMGIKNVFDPLPKEIPILPQFLKVEGYRTAGIVASVQLSAQFGFDKGFDLLDIGTTYLQWTGIKQALSRLGLVHFGDVYPRYDAAELTDRAIDWIGSQRLEGSEPLFMYLHYADPHAPYRPPPAEDRWREFAPEQARRLAEPPFSPTYHGELSGARAQALEARYDAEIAFFDRHFQRLLDYLEESGIYDDSLIVFTSDHGEEFAEHGGWAHAHSLYNELLHVPLIVKYPTRNGPPSGQRIRAVTALVDVVPTIRDILEATWPESIFRGRSLLRERLGEDEYAVFARNEYPSLRALVRGSDKLIQKISPDGEVVDENYYSLASDFGETDHGLPAGASLEWLTEMRSLLAGLDSLAVESEKVQLDEETRRELEALGYL